MAAFEAVCDGKVCSLTTARDAPPKFGMWTAYQIWHVDAAPKFGMWTDTRSA